MNNMLNKTRENVNDIVQRTGSITLANLECAMDTSFNLLFLAIEQLIAENKIKIRRGEWDYIISTHENTFDSTIEKKIKMIQPSPA
ncbi:MAG: hypothetical protein HZA08_01825 [Nitrospirae bacterium]|nr:hypothetical protein [Nitrospirota bacterium]